MIKKFVAKKLGSKLAKRFSKKTMSAAQKRALAKAVKASALARKKSVTKVVSKRAAKRLAKIDTLMKANQQAIKHLKKGTTTVYRVQNARGEGPLMGKNLKVYANMPLNIKRGYKVAPVSNYNRRRAAMLKKLAPKGTPFEEINFTRRDKFGFSSKAQSLKYFSRQEQDYLASKGFKLVAIENAKVVGKTKTQVAFYTNTKDLARLQKEATRLTNKYKKLST